MWIPIFMNTKQVQHFCRYSKSQAEANARKGSEFFLLFLRCILYHQDINQVHRIRENPVLYLLNSISKLKPEKGFVDRSVYICFCICRQKYLYCSCPKVLPDAWRGWTVQDPDNGEKPSARPSSTWQGKQWGARWKDGEGNLVLHLFIITIKKNHDPDVKPSSWVIHSTWPSLNFTQLGEISGDGHWDLEIQNLVKRYSET